VGDSVHAQVWQGLIYELQRRNYETTLSNNMTQREGFWKTKIIYFETLLVRSLYPSEDSAKNTATLYFFQVFKLPFLYPDDMDRVVNLADVLVLGFGLHWNFNDVNLPLSWPSHYVTELSNLLSFIRTNGTKTKLLIHRETSAQHFDAPGGDFSLW
jgi:hypothetical protein